MRTLAPLLMFCIGCTFSGPAGTDPTGNPDPGADAGDPGTDAATPACEAGALECTGADTLGTCRADGSGFEEVGCAAGCLTSPAPHCATFTPSNGVSSGAATGALDTAGRAVWVLFTDTGAIVDGDSGEVVRAAGEGVDVSLGIGFEIVAQTDAPDIGVFQLASLDVAGGTRIRGVGANALAIAVSGDLEIAGVIDASGGRTACVGDDRGLTCAGPGGFAGGASDTDGFGPDGSFGGGGENNDGESGGGGGGYGLGGGSGGAAESSTAGAAGAPFGTEAIVPLIGGAGGGGGGTEVQNNCIAASPPFPGGTGGGGGGAVQLVAERLTFVAGDLCGVTAGGGGGNGGQCNAAGGGGGAGGGILLEAAVIDLASGCVLAANGGAGGSSSSLGILGAGQDGRLSTEAAAGGNTLDGTGGGAGGTTNPAGSANDNDNEAGGGGGGAGRVRINSAAGRRTLDGDISPTASAGDLALE